LTVSNYIVARNDYYGVLDTHGEPIVCIDWTTTGGPLYFVHARLRAFLFIASSSRVARDLFAAAAVVP
jgi:hypothetical protein